MASPSYRNGNPRYGCETTTTVAVFQTTITGSGSKFNSVQAFCKMKTGGVVASNDHILCSRKNKEEQEEESNTGVNIRETWDERCEFHQKHLLYSP